MNHPHSDQRDIKVYERAPALSPCTHLVNAPVFPLDFDTSALIPTRREHPKSPLIVDGEVITSTVILPASRENTDATAVVTTEPKRSLFRRAIEDPYWILMTLMTAVGLSITATVIYSVIHIILAVTAWLSVHGKTIITTTILIIVLVISGGATATKCAGIRCRGCQR